MQISNNWILPNQFNRAIFPAALSLLKLQILNEIVNTPAN